MDFPNSGVDHKACEYRAVAGPVDNPKRVGFGLQASDAKRRHGRYSREIEDALVERCEWSAIQFNVTDSERNVPFGQDVDPGALESQLGASIDFPGVDCLGAIPSRLT
jgi:hypothetical protein